MRTSFNVTDPDLFQKLIAFCLIKLNTQNIYRNIKYTYFLRNKLSIDSDEDYYVSLFYYAFEFLEKLNSKKLSISKNEYNYFIDEFDKKELLKNGKQYPIDYNYENKLVNILNKTNLNPLEEYEKNASMKKSSDIFMEGILSMNTEKLHNDYLSGRFSDISLTKFESMHNDMKIILKMIEAQKAHNNTQLSPTGSHINSTKKENGINIIDL